MSGSKIYVRLDGAEHRQSFSFLIEMQQLESKWMQPPPSLHLELLTAFGGERGNPPKRPIFVPTQANLWSRQTELAIWTNSHPSSAVRGQSQPHPPPHHHHHHLPSSSQTDLEEPAQRIYVTEVCLRTDRQETFIVIHRISRRGTVVSAETFWMLAPPPLTQAPSSHFVSLGNEAVQCSLLLNVGERKCGWMDNEARLVSQSASTTSWWFWAKWITALKSYICS